VIHGIKVELQVIQKCLMLAPFATVAVPANSLRRIASPHRSCRSGGAHRGATRRRCAPPASCRGSPNRPNISARTGWVSASARYPTAAKGAERRARDLEDERVIAALGRTGRPCRVDRENQIPLFPDATRGAPLPPPAACDTGANAEADRYRHGGRQPANASLTCWAYSPNSRPTCVANASSMGSPRAKAEGVYKGRRLSMEARESAGIEDRRYGNC
jgi:hypothetical protein